MAGPSEEHYALTPNDPTGSVVETVDGDVNSDTLNQKSDEFFDDEHVYANVQELKEESRRKEKPPTPDVTDKPVRDLGSGWLEYSTETGRPYFFNRERGECSWKPPRFQKLKLSTNHNEEQIYDTVPPATPSPQVAQRLQTPQKIAHLTQFLQATQFPQATRFPQPTQLSKAAPKTSEMTNEDQMPSCSASSSQEEKCQKESTEHNEAGISKALLNAWNRGNEKRLLAQSLNDAQSFMSNEERFRGEASQYGVSSSAHDDESSSTSYGSASNVAHKSVKSGNLDKVSGILRSGTLDACKIAEIGINIKKKEWASCYVFLSAAHLIFYKDARSAEKLGRHYEAPLGMCDLRGADVQWYEDKRRKHVLQLKLIDGTIYLFNTPNCQDINSWFHAIKRVIRKQRSDKTLQPLPDTYSTTVVENPECGSAVVRTGSLTQSASSSPFGTTQNRRSSKKFKSVVKESPYSMYDDLAFEAPVTKARVVDKLKRFFRTRPTIESLKEKGIYRTEPVFGNSLLAICQQEKSLVPRFIFVVTEVIELRGLETDGIYRVSGNLSSIQRIRCAVDQDRYAEVLNEEDVHVLTGALKLFFRELSEPIFPAQLSKDFIKANQLPKGDKKIKLFNEMLKKLPLVHRETLRILFSHLLRVAERSSKNRMEIHNLAIVFGPSLFSCNNENTPSAYDYKKSSSNGKKKGKADKFSYKEKYVAKPTGVQSNSHFVFNMIMQGQIVEFLLTEFNKLSVFQESPIEETSV